MLNVSPIITSMKSSSQCQFPNHFGVAFKVGENTLPTFLWFSPALNKQFLLTYHQLVIIFNITVICVAESMTSLDHCSSMLFFHWKLQEEQIVSDSNNSASPNDSSWKAGSNSSVLMRASQVSSEFNPGDQSYLRLSLGQFFEQRSEALGCLGSANNVDGIKRVSDREMLSCLIKSYFLQCPLPEDLRS